VDLGRTVTLAGALVSTAAAGIVVSRIAFGALADALGSGARLYAIVCAGSCLPWTALALTTPGTPDAALFAIAVLFGATVGSWVGLQHAELARATPNADFAEAAAAVTFVMFAGLTASGVVVTLAAAATGGLAACFVALGAMGLAVGLYQFVKPLPPGAAQEKI
jgi:MFS family permease